MGIALELVHALDGGDAAPELPRPAALRAGVVQLGAEEVVLFERPANVEQAGAAEPPAGGRFGPLRLLHACFAPEPAPGAWLRGVLSALEEVAPGAPPFARVDALAAGGTAWLLGAGSAEAQEDPAGPELLQAIGPERYRDLLRSWPPAQLLSHRLRTLPPAVERRAAAILAAHGLPEALMLFAGEVDGCALAIGLPIAPGVRPGSRTVGLLRHVAGHLAAARRLRGWAGLDGAPGAAATPAPVAAARSVAPLAVEALDAGLAIGWTDAAGASALWRRLGQGAYAIVDQWITGGRRRLLARRTEHGDPAALRPAEVEIVAHLARGRTVEDIASRLALSAATVTSHLRSARFRLRVASSLELADALG